jgi:hypothetical protein
MMTLTSRDTLQTEARVVLARVCEATLYVNLGRFALYAMVFFQSSDDKKNTDCGG